MDGLGRGAFGVAAARWGRWRGGRPSAVGVYPVRGAFGVAASRWGRWRGGRPSAVGVYPTGVSHLGQDVFEKLAICPRIRHRLLRGCADLAALDHDRPVESGGFQRAEDACEVDPSCAELN